MTIRVLVTRAAEQAAALEAALRDHGLEPVVVPAIAVEIDPPRGRLDVAARNLHTFDWVVITSPNGARAILTAAERVFTSLGTPSWAAIGDPTAHVLEREAIDIDFRPSRANERALAEELPIRRGQAVVLLRGDLADAELPERLHDRGAEVFDVVAYRTIEAPVPSRSLLTAALATEPPSAVLFASGSAVRGLVSLAVAVGVEVRSLAAICIGPETAREADRLGFYVLAAAQAQDVETLAGTAAAALAQPSEAP